VKGTLWCIAGVVSFSLTLPATRAAVPELGALFVGAGRSLIAGVLALLLLSLRRERFPREHAVALAVVAASVVFGFPLATALALRSVPAAHATIVIGLVPLATVLYAVARNGERPSREFWIAALVGGAAVVLFGESRGGLELHGADGWLLAAVVLAALGYSEGARLAKTLGGFRVISWALVMALPASLPLSLFAWPERPLASISPGALGGLFYVSLVSMYLGMIAWYRGLAQGSVAHASQIQLLQPVLSLGWGALLLGEALSPVTLLAAGLVLACAVWARRARVALPRAALVGKHAT
jgi:drug/metabolite transporter (DMT)-like permease